MRTAIALFTRDLRVHDNPMLAAAARADAVLPLFVHDAAITAGRFAANPRARFLAESLADLDSSLRERGAALVTRSGDLVEQVCRIAGQAGADEVHLSTDVSRYAGRRQARLGEALAERGVRLRCHEEVTTVLGPGRVLPSGRGADHFAVFTPYHRRWEQVAKRRLATAPARLRLPEGIDPGPAHSRTAPDGVRPGGEAAGRARAADWFAGGIEHYHARSDDLGSEGTSELSPYLHFGCLSPAELVSWAGDGGGHGGGQELAAGPAAFVRQVAWRDFHHQVLAARPETAWRDYRPRGDRWRDDEQALAAWRDGRTGVPVVDAGMRQLRETGWMHNRVRLITGSFLTKTLYIDWRAGAWHFFDHLLDGDIANNCMNWQWVAGTGTDTRPNRVLNPLRQAQRYDPDGAYVRRWVPELSDLGVPEIHEPWRLDRGELRRRDYPPPIVDLDAARERFLAARGQ